MLSRRHHELSTFGLLKDSAVPEVRGYVEQLLAQGFLRQTDDAFPVVALTNEGVELLRNPDCGARPGAVAAATGRPRTGAAQVTGRGRGLEGVDRDLFEKLRGVRMQIARWRGVPPYVVFHDTTLRELARLKRKQWTRRAPSTASARERRRTWARNS